MSKYLPYFKFNVNRWITGTITSLPFATQGVFTNILAWYWSKECDFSYSKIVEKFPKKHIEKLINAEILKRDGEIMTIDFLDMQLSERKVVSKVNAENGSKGGKSKSYKSKNVANATTSVSNIEKKREEENRYIFKISENLFEIKVSEYFIKNNQSFFEQWMMKNKNLQHLENTVLEKMDMDYHGYTFSDNNHVQNAFKKTWEKVVNEKPSHTSQPSSKKALA